MKKTDDINKQYKLGKKLGQGGFSQVYMCTHTTTNTNFAMKIIKKESMKTKKFLIPFMKREIDILKGTEHPNIVRIIDMFEDEVNVYIVSELMRGGDLYTYMERNKKISET